MITITGRPTSRTVSPRSAAFNRAADWRESANKLNDVTLITYYNAELTDRPSIDPAWASLAEEASKSWSKENPF